MGNTGWEAPIKAAMAYNAEQANVKDGDDGYCPVCAWTLEVKGVVKHCPFCGWTA
jgi:rubrerythrin